MNADPSSHDPKSSTPTESTGIPDDDRYVTPSLPASGELTRETRDAAHRAAAAELTTLADFGDYEILGEIARGGMGIVYRARQKSLDREVALKMILARHHATEAEMVRFRHEARAAANLHHPGIVQIHEIGEVNGQQFFSMELIEGESLQFRLRDGPLQARVAAAVVQQVALAVEHAHQHGVVHRDIKPGNVLLDVEASEDRHHGRHDTVAIRTRLVAKLTDFGLARSQSAEGLSLTGEVMGTPSFMAPEQARGDRHRIGPRSDVYGLGALLYCTLTGRPPFHAATPLETLGQVLGQEPVAPRRLNAGVPRDLETVCLKCLEKDPDKRYDGAKDLADDLDRFLEGKEVKARPVGSIGRLRKWVRRRPAIAGLLVVSFLAALACVGAVVGVLYGSKLKKINAELSSARGAEAEARAEEARLRKLAENYLYGNRIGRIVHDRESGNLGRARALLRQCTAERRGWEWHYLNRLCHSELRVISSNSAPLTCVAVSPDQKLIATGALEGALLIWNAQSGSLIQSVHAHKWTFAGLAFSPDGRHLATSAGAAREPDTVLLWEVDRAAVDNGRAPLGRKRDLKLPVGEQSEVAFDPTSKYLAVAFGDVGEAEGRAVIVQLDNPTGPRRELKTGPGGCFTLAFAPDGKKLATANGLTNLGVVELRAGVQVWDVSSGRPLERPKGPVGNFYSIDYSPDGKYLAAAGYDRAVHVWDVEEWKHVGSWHDFTGNNLVQQIKFHPDSRQPKLAAACGDGRLRIWQPVTGELLNVLHGHEAEMTGVGWLTLEQGAGSVDQVVSVSRDKSMRFWDVDATPRADVIAAHKRSCSSIAYHPNGRWVASASNDRFAKLLDVEQKKVVRLFGPCDEPVWAVALSPDGRLVATGGGDWSKKEQKGEIRIWETKTGKLLYRLAGHSGIVWDVAFSKDGKELATGGGEFIAKGEVLVWDVATGKPVHELRQPSGVLDVAYSPDGSVLLGVSRVAKLVKLWNLRSEKVLHELPWTNAMVNCATFSSDGRYLAIGAEDYGIQVWRTQDWKLLHVLKGHVDSPTEVLFSRGDMRIVSCSLDQSIRIWDAGTGQELLALEGHRGAVWGIALSPSGDRLASAGEDGTVRIWDARQLPK